MQLPHFSEVTKVKENSVFTEGKDPHLEPPKTMYITHVSFCVASVFNIHTHSLLDLSAFQYLCSILYWSSISRPHW